MQLTDSCIALCYGVAASVASNFLTQVSFTFDPLPFPSSHGLYEYFGLGEVLILCKIIGRFKYSVVKTNLFTVAPYVFGTIALLVTAFSSDHFRERGFHLGSSLAMVIIGCVILAAIPISSHGAGYFATFLITGGAFTPSVLFHVWHQCNDPTEDGRAFRVGTFSKVPFSFVSVL